MNLLFDISVVAACFAVNLLLFGVLAAIAVAAAFRLLPTVAPRARYLLVVGAFAAAVLLPTTATLRPLIKAEPLPTRQTLSEPADEVYFFQAQAIEQSLATGQAFAPPFEPLSDFAVFVGRSRAGIVFVALWTAISFLLLLREWFGHLRLRRARRNWQPATVEQRRELNCPDRVPLYFAADESPCAVGFFRPAIILPAGFANELLLASCRSVVRHEAAHARWRDPLVGALLRVARAMFWVSPALWYLERLARAEREAAADCAVVNFLPASDRENAAVEYAATLVAVAKLSSSAARNSRVELMAIRFGGNSPLEKRVRRLFAGYRRPTFARSFSAIIIVLTGFSATAFLPVASQPPETFARLSNKNQTGETVRTSAPTLSAPNSDSTFGENFDFAENPIATANQKSVDDRVKRKKPDEITSAQSIVSASPTPPAGSLEQKVGAQPANEEIPTKPDAAILPGQAHTVEQPQPVTTPQPAAVPSVPVTPTIAEKPVKAVEPQLPKSPHSPKFGVRTFVFSGYNRCEISSGNGGFGFACK